MTQLASPPPTRRSLRDGTSTDEFGQRGPGTPSRGTVLASSHSVSAGRAAQRGRHATSSGQGFGFLIGWTLASAVLPGSGLVAAGRRISGWLLVSISFGSVLGVVFYVLASGGPMNAAMAMRDLALDPVRLTQLAVAAAVAGVAWCLVVLFSHVALRRQAIPTGLQNLAATCLVTALVLGISVPAAKASNLALIQKDFLNSVFSGEPQAEPKTAAPAVQKKDPWAGVPRVNVLLMGSDAGKGRTGLRPDALILASVNTKTGDTVMFSLPRNLSRPPFPEGSEGAQAWPNGFGLVGGGPSSDCGKDGSFCFLSSVWQTAEESAASYFPGDKNPGLTATEQAVEGVLGLKVDYYVMLDLEGFSDFVDAIDGVTIDVKERLPMGGDSNHRVAVFGWIEAGENQHMDGFHALWFARSRWSKTDYDRMRRQRCVIGAVAKQADPLKVVQNFGDIAKALKHNLQTDIPVKELTAWGDLAMRIKDGKVRSLPFTNEVITSGNADWEKIRELVQKSLKAPKKKATVTTSPSTTDGATGGSGTGVGTGTGTGTGTEGGTGAGDKPGSGTGKTTETPKPIDPSKAQDVDAVC